MKSRKKAKMFQRLQAAVVQCVAASQQSLQSVSSVSNMASIISAQETEAIQSVVVLSVEGLAATQIRKQKIKKKVKKRDDAKKKQRDASVDSEDTCLDDSMNDPLHIRREDIAKLDEIREGNAMEKEDVREINRKENEEQKVSLTSDEESDYRLSQSPARHNAIVEALWKKKKDKSAFGK